MIENHLHSFQKQFFNISNTIFVFNHANIQSNTCSTLPLKVPPLYLFHASREISKTNFNIHPHPIATCFFFCPSKRKAFFFWFPHTQTGMNGAVASERVPRYHPVQSTKSAGKTRAARPPVHKHVPLRPTAPPPGVLPQADLFVTRRSTYPALLRRCTRLFFGSTKRSSSLPIPILRFSRFFITLPTPPRGQPKPCRDWPCTHWARQSPLPWTSRAHCSSASASPSL